MTILEALRWANNDLKKNGIDSPMLDAEILLANVLQMSRAKLFAYFSDQMKTHQQEKFLLLVERRGRSEPIAYIIGKKSFFGRDFLVNPFVLIPRPETELMVESALEIFESIKEKDLTLFADIGTGSGAIAVTIALETQTPTVAIDQSERSLRVSKENAKKYSAEAFLDFRHGDLLDPLLGLFERIRKTSKKPVSSVYPFKHLIVCANLPYLSSAQMERLPDDVRLYEPATALEAGPDGMEAYFRLLRQIKKHRDELPRRMALLMEIDPSQAKRATQLITHELPSANVLIKKDLLHLERLVVAEL